MSAKKLKHKSKSLDTTYENQLLQKGYDYIIGIDEAGRGPWAGPIYVAAYIFGKSSKPLSNITDSKLLTHEQRQANIKLLPKSEYLFVYQDNKFIDKYGLSRSVTDSILEITKQIQTNFQGKMKFLIDGYFKEKFEFDYEMIKKGDSKYYSIAAASIVAKVKRDEFMSKIAPDYPEYAFDRHKGYGTKQHQKALKKFGVCAIHRRSFKPIAKVIGK
ncbi:ribonuclease HII [Candidatus Dojkabacteria bacterium]|nr:ribonuclease HII [Candidatus Dojkabacteria bacterium]